MWYPPLIWHWMLDNLPVDEEKPGGHRNVVLRKDSENSMDGSSNQQVSIKENGNLKNRKFAGPKKTAEISLWVKGAEKNLTVKEHTDLKRYRRNQGATYLTILCQWMVELVAITLKTGELRSDTQERKSWWTMIA